MRFILNLALGLVLGLILFNATSLPVIAGSFKVESPSSQVDINCQLNDANCYFEQSVVFTNDTGQDLYSTTLWTSSSLAKIEYVDFNGNWTSGQSTADYVVKPGQGVNVLVKVAPPQEPGQHSASLYIDAKTCNLKTTPPDCYFYGGSEFVVIFHLKKSDPQPTPTATNTLTPTLIPTATPVFSSPSPTPIPTSTSFPKATPTLILTPTLTPTPTAAPKSSPRVFTFEDHPAPLSTPVLEPTSSPSDVSQPEESSRTPLPRVISFSRSSRPKIKITKSLSANPVPETKRRNIFTFIKLFWDKIFNLTALKSFLLNH